MKRIAIEEHFCTEDLAENYRLISEGKYPVPEVIKDEEMLDIEIKWLPTSRYAMPNADTVLSKLLDIQEIRLREMDEAGIDIS